MNPRIIKEVRLLFGPWCLVVVAALLPLLRGTFHWSKDFASVFCSVGFFAGVPFLAALSLGGEFQQRTIALLLGQPVERTRIWAEKQMVLLVVLAALIPCFWFGWYDPNDLNGESLSLVGAWLLATLSSATFWTLLTRSTLGGLVLGQFAQLLVATVAVRLGYSIFGHEPSARALHVAQALGASLCLGYSGVMLWLGLRKLARFQATGGIAGDDLLTVGPRMVPRFLGELLRCRPTGLTLNLMRKELRLLRPLWLITLLFLACWVCIVITFRVVPQTGAWKEWRQLVPMVFICFYVPLSVMLAGCLSLGEERTSGTHAWQLTLPVSARQQWFIKMVMALGAGVFCAMVVPFLAVSVGQLLLGSPFGTDFKWGFRWSWPSVIDVLPLVLGFFVSFPAFWCACAVNGTVRAALWTLPVMGALCAAGAGGIWVGEQVGEHWGETLSMPLTAIVSKFQLNPHSLMNEAYRWREIGLVFPPLIAAVFQSYWLFRRQPSDRIFPVIRRLVPMGMVAFCGALVCAALMWAIGWQTGSVLVTETSTAIRQCCIDAKNSGQAIPSDLTVDDLAKASPISEPTRRWLRDVKIAVAPAERGLRNAPRYVACLHFSPRSEYRIDFYLR